MVLFSLALNLRKLKYLIYCRMNSRTAKDSSSLDSVLEMIGKKLFQLRVKKGYKSHASFAEAHNLPRVQYWRMEKGKSNVTLRSLHKVLSIHHMTLEQLFEEINEENRLSV